MCSLSTALDFPVITHGQFISLYFNIKYKYNLAESTKMVALQFMVATLHYMSCVAQSVQCLTADWTTGVLSSAEANNFSSSLCV
jgi:hypothetical protein